MISGMAVVSFDKIWKNELGAGAAHSLFIWAAGDAALSLSEVLEILMELGASRL